MGRPLEFAGADHIQLWTLAIDADQCLFACANFEGTSSQAHLFAISLTQTKNCTQIFLFITRGSQIGYRVLVIAQGMSLEIKQYDIMLSEEEGKLKY